MPDVKRASGTALDAIDDDGAFKRRGAGHRHKSGTFVPAKDRYHLYVSLACPWAHGTLIALHLKGLVGVVSHSVVHPTWCRTRPDDPNDLHTGWQFRAPGDPAVASPSGYGSFPCDEALIPDGVNGCKTIREVYELAGDTEKLFTTPLLWDKQTKRIVTNESMDILRIFDKDFQDLAANPSVDLFPPGWKLTRAEELNAVIYPCINNGVYRCGFAKSQLAYDIAAGELFAALDLMEAHLEGRGEGFLTGDRFTWIDLRLYGTLVRFDTVYHTYFKTNSKRIEDYPNLLAFLRRCYAIPEVGSTTNMQHIKQHYFSSHPTLNPYAIVPAGDGPRLGSPSPGAPAAP